MGEVERAAGAEPEGVLWGFVRSLAARGSTALARVWLRHEDELRLVASAGSPRAKGESWSRIDGSHRTVALGHGKVGKVGASGTGMLLHDMSERSAWITRPGWARAEGIQSFAAQPLVWDRQVLGVVGVFARERLDAEAFATLRVAADQAAAALAATRAAERARRRCAVLEVENAGLSARLFGAPGAARPVGASLAWATVLAQVDVAATTDATVLVTGEPGTGKDLVARLIHERSGRSAEPFVSVDCAEGLAGAGAVDRGTLVLDEVALLSREAEAALERLLDRPRARIVATTSRTLRDEVAAGRFRDRLLHLLSTFPIAVPPLRERPADVAPLAAHYLRAMSVRLGRAEPRLSPRELRVLERHAWPGNVRELIHVMEHAVLTGRLDPGPPPPPATRGPRSLHEEAVISSAEWRCRERANLEAALRQAGGRVYGRGGAAALLGVPPTTFASRLKALGIAPPR